MSSTISWVCGTTENGLVDLNGPKPGNNLQLKSSQANFKAKICHYGGLVEAVASI